MPKDIHPFVKTAGSNALVSAEDASMALVAVEGDPVIPDTVTLPHDLGGRTEPVTDSFTLPCPVCKGEQAHRCLHLVLETLSVAECPKHGFLWYRTRTTTA